MAKRYTTREIADLLGISHQRIAKKISEGHFPSHAKCECGYKILIDKSDLKRKENTNLRAKNGQR